MICQVAAQLPIAKLTTEVGGYRAMLFEDLGSRLQNVNYKVIGHLLLHAATVGSEN